MTIRTYLIGMAISTLICFTAWSLILVYIEPVSSGLFGFALFYLALFFSLTGVFTVAGFAVRASRMRNNNRFFPLVTRSFRQGLLLTIVLIISLVLQSQRILTAVNILTLVAIVSVIEIYFLHRYERGF